MKNWRKCTFLLASALSAGCGSAPLTKATTVASQDEAAQVLVSVTNVAPWDQVAAQMQPNFSLTGDQALLQVLPITAKVQEQVLSAFGATLGIGLPQNTNSSTATSTSQTSKVVTTPATGPETTASTATTSSNSSMTDAIAAGVAPVAPTGMPAGGALPAAAIAAGDVGVGPLLKYQAARDLFESVQMMNRELPNAAVLRCYVPFLVRIRVAVVPYRPNLGYALNTRIGFFPNEDGDKDQAGELKLNSDTGIGATKLVRAPAHLHADPCTDATYLPQVVPILAADDMERALKSRAVEVAQQLGLSLSAMVQNAGVGAGLNQVNQSLSSIASHDFSSRLTVSRQADNTLFVRIGPTNQATAGAALAPQNYDIALLLLAPRAYFKKEDAPFAVFDRQIQVVSHTQFRNAQTGEILPERSASALVRQVDRVMQQILGSPARADLLSSWHRLSVIQKETVARALATPIQQANLNTFEELLAEPFAGTGTPGFSLEPLVGTNSVRTLWVTASTMLSDTALKTAYFQLRKPADLMLVKQTAIVLDDGKAQAKAQLQTLDGNSASAVLAKLNITSKTQAYSFPAQSIAIDPVSHMMTLSFVSPALLEISDIDYSDPKKTNISLSSAACADELLCPRLVEEAPRAYRTSIEFPIIIKKTAAAEATSKLKLTSTTGTVVAEKNGSGSLAVSISDVGEEVAALTITGGAGTIVSASDGAGTSIALATDGSISVTRDTLVRLKLENLRPNAQLSIGVGPRRDKKIVPVQTLTIAVVSNN